MFSRKPRPPHCEDLTDAEVKWVRKIIGERYAYKQVTYAEKLVERGWHDVFPAVAAQDRFVWGEDRKYQFLSAMINNAPIETSIRALSKMGQMRVSYAGSLLAQLLVKLEGGDQRLATAVIASQQDANLLAAIVKSLCDRSDMNAQRHGFIRALIAQGADVHYDTGGLLKTALKRGYVAVAEELTAAGFDYVIYGETLRSYLVEKEAPHAALVYIDKVTGRSAANAATLVAPREANGYLRAGDSVSRCDQLAGGGSLTTVFNFATRQQIVIAHVAGQTAAPVVTPFSQIEGDAGLLLAAEAFVLQGGTAALAEAVVLGAPRSAMRIEKPVAALPAKTSAASPR